MQTDVIAITVPSLGWQGLTHMQVSPLISGSDMCRGSRNGGGSLDSHQNETERPPPQTLKDKISLTFSERPYVGF